MPVVTNVGGWNPWHYLKSYFSGRVVPYATFPDSYLPSGGFWFETLSSHCAIPVPWANIDDLFGAFELAGGSSGTVIGSLSGLQSVYNILSQKNSIIMSIGGQDYPPPTVGYCIGNLYHEQTYFFVNITHLITTEVTSQSNIDVFQRSRFRRLYLYQGAIVRYTVDSTGKNILTLDMDGSVPQGMAPIIAGSNIKITRKSDGGTVTVQVKEVRDNWDMVITDPGTPVPLADDFYVFDRVFCIRDPFRLCGYWWGTENDGTSVYPDSGKNLHLTSQNHFYDNIVFTGAYVYFNKVTNKVAYVNVGSTMNDTGDFEWRWVKYAAYTQSQIFGDDPNRYKETQEITDTATDSLSFQATTRTTATQDDVTTWVNMKQATYVRLEINRGGSAISNNWHAPILQNSWLKQNGKYYKIMAQADGATIDVSLLDITGKTVIDYNAGGEIFNQYGWFISEHFMTDANYGIFGGNSWSGSISSGTETGTNTTSKVVIHTPGENIATLINNTVKFSPAYMGNVNSFYNRFRLDAPLGGTIKTFNKLDGWLLVSSNGTTFKIKSISYSAYPTPAQPFTPYDVTVEVYGNINTITAGSKLWITFDTPYQRMNSTISGTYLYTITGVATADNKPEVCVDWSWQSAPIAMAVPKNMVVGVCSGLWWGLTTQVAVSNEGLDMLLTTPAPSRGISALFSRVPQQDLIFYRDYYTNKLTIRRGELDFREHPNKIEISIGIADSTATASTFPIILDKSKERLKAIHMDMGAGKYSACTFRTGNTSDYFGFLVNGGGEVDLQATRRLGHAPGTIPPSDFKFKGYYVSPFYLYNADPSVSPMGTKIMYMGMKVQDDPIYVSNNNPTDTNPKNMKLEYVKTNQTIERMGHVDAHELNDGELVVIYGRPVDNAFSIDTNVYNTSANPWTSKNGIFVIGSANSGYEWGCPMVKDLKFKSDDKYQYSLMVLNNADYAESIYEPRTENLKIFAKCYGNNSVAFIGMLGINTLDLPTNVQLCASSKASDQKFLWREPLLDTILVNDQNRTYTQPQFLIGAPMATTSKDNFVRVMGPKGTNSSVTSNLQDWGILSSHMLSDGTYILLYDAPDGVRFISSSSTGNTWIKSSILLAPNAANARLIGENLLCYIALDGIEVKILTEMDMLKACAAIEGVAAADIEALQGYFDLAETVLIGSGRITAQRLAGYKSIDGIYKIFYYDPDNFLSCLQSSDRRRWKIAPNF